MNRVTRRLESDAPVTASVTGGHNLTETCQDRSRPRASDSPTEPRSRGFGPRIPAPPAAFRGSESARRPRLAHRTSAELLRPAPRPAPRPPPFAACFHRRDSRHVPLAGRTVGEPPRTTLASGQRYSRRIVTLPRTPYPRPMGSARARERPRLAAPKRLRSLEISPMQPPHLRFVYSLSISPLKKQPLHRYCARSPAGLAAPKKSPRTVSSTRPCTRGEEGDAHATSPE